MPMHVMAERTLADIHIEQQYTLLGKYQCECKVARDESLAGSLIEGGEGDDLGRMLLAAHKLHVGTQDAECLRSHIVSIGCYHHLLSFALGA